MANAQTHTTTVDVEHDARLRTEQARLERVLLSKHTKPEYSILIKAKWNAFFLEKIHDFSPSIPPKRCRRMCVHAHPKQNKNKHKKRRTHASAHMCSNKRYPGQRINRRPQQQWFHTGFSTSYQVSRLGSLITVAGGLKNGSLDCIVQKSKISGKSTGTKHCNRQWDINNTTAAAADAEAAEAVQR